MSFLASLGLDAFGSLMGFGGAALGYKYNKRLMEQQMAWNTSEREAQQKYNTSERIAAQNYNTGEREAQNAYAEQMYNTYSSPEALARQYSDAGLNPRLAIGANSAGSVAASSGHSATVSPQSSGMLGITPPYQDVNALSQGYINVANALKTIGEAKQTGVETRWLEESFNDRLRELKYGADAQEFAAEIAKINARFLPKEKRLLLRQMITDIAEGKATAEKLKAETNKLKDEGYITEKISYRINEIISSYVNKRWSEHRLNTAQAKAYEIENDYRPERIRAEILNTNADTYLKEHQGDYMAYQAYIEKMDAALQDISFGEQTAYTLESYRRGIQNLGIMQAQLLNDLEIARKENDFKRYEQISNLIKDIGVAIGGVSMLRRGKGK